MPLPRPAPSGVRPGTKRGAGTSPKAPGRSKAKPKARKRRSRDPVKAWARRLERTRPGLVGYVLDQLAQRYGRPTWERRWDPTSELVLTILTQNSADTNAERAFEALRRAYPTDGPVQQHRPGPGWGGKGLPDGVTPDWLAIELTPLEELIEVIRTGGLPVAKAKGIQAALRAIRAQRGDHSLEFLGEMPALEAREWLTQIPGIGKKTASLMLLFCFGTPLMPVDRHVERVGLRVGLLPRKQSTRTDPHEVFLALLEPDQMYEAHVNLIQHGRVICHARNPEHDLCPVRDRCRFVNPKAP
jgi:endonuclease III